jgi:hypothetical protein
MNPFQQPVDPSTGQLITTRDPANQFTSPYTIPSGSTNGNGGFLGNDGFLSKAGETALDLFGIYGNYEIEKAKIENAGSGRQDPQITDSQARAGFFPVSSEFPLKEFAIGGAIVAGVSVLIIGAIITLKD